MTTTTTGRPNGVGVYGVGKGAGTGVYGLSDTSTGVHGEGGGADPGMIAANYGSGPALQARGNGAGAGIVAYATANHAIDGALYESAPGMAGVSGSGRGTGTYGILGANDNPDATTGDTGAGVYGTSKRGIGVYGVSGGGATGQPFGVVGTVQSAPGFALYGLATVSGPVGFVGGASVAGAIAGQFSGPVNVYNTSPTVPGNLYVQGNYQVSGTKSACRTRMARTGCCTAWNRPKRGSRTSARARSRRARRK